MHGVWDWASVCLNGYLNLVMQCFYLEIHYNKVILDKNKTFAKLL